MWREVVDFPTHYTLCFPALNTRHHIVEHRTPRLLGRAFFYKLLRNFYNRLKETKLVLNSKRFDYSAFIKNLEVWYNTL